MYFFDRSVRKGTFFTNLRHYEAEVRMRGGTFGPACVKSKEGEGQKSKKHKHLLSQLDPSLIILFKQRTRTKEIKHTQLTPEGCERGKQQKVGSSRKQQRWRSGSRSGAPSLVFFRKLEDEGSTRRSTVCERASPSSLSPDTPLVALRLDCVL